MTQGSCCSSIVTWELVLKFDTPAILVYSHDTGNPEA